MIRRFRCLLELGIIPSAARCAVNVLLTAFRLALSEKLRWRLRERNSVSQSRSVNRQLRLFELWHHPVARARPAPQAATRIAASQDSRPRPGSRPEYRTARYGSPCPPKPA